MKFQHLSLDALANDGKILTNYHTNLTCSPARLALLTGVDNHIGGLGSMAEKLTPNQVGKPGYEGYINDKVVTVPRTFENLRIPYPHDRKVASLWKSRGLQTVLPPYDRGFEEVFTSPCLSGGTAF